MNEIKSFKPSRPWRDALLATTGLSAFIFFASLLWSAGYPQWAFALAFVAVWLLLSISWSNIEFTEKSGSILADVMDHNFAHIDERIEKLEKRIAKLKALKAPPKPSPSAQSGPPSEDPHEGFEGKSYP